MKNIKLLSGAVLALCGSLFAVNAAFGANITAQEAKKAAFKHANVNEAEVVFVNVNMDDDKYENSYDVEFYAGNKEYDYEIDASTGKIISYDYDINEYNRKNIKLGERIALISQNAVKNSKSLTSTKSQYIGEVKAKEIALNHAGLSQNAVTFVCAEFDFEDGRAEYEVEFYSTNKEYDYEIDAITGNILHFDYEAEGYNGTYSEKNTDKTSENQYIGENEAKNKALSYAGVSEKSAAYTKVEFEYDSGRAVYEVEFNVGKTEYSFKIDAVKGNVIEYEKDND